MALKCPLSFSTMATLKKDEVHAPARFFSFSGDYKNYRLVSTLSHRIHLHSNGQAFGKLDVYASQSAQDVEFDDGKEKEKVNEDSDSDTDDDPFTMTNEERAELRRKIRQMVANSPDVEEEQDSEEKRKKMQKLLADYPLVVEEEDPDWPEDADGRGFNLDQFFDKITIKNVKKDNDEDYDSDK